MPIQFLAHVSDDTAQQALAVLEQHGYETHLVSGEIHTYPGTVSLFSVPELRRKRTARCIRLSTHRMGQENIPVPAWAAAHVYRVAVSEKKLKERPENCARALLQMAREYAAWHPWMERPDAPWNPLWHDNNVPHVDFPQWKDAARKQLGELTTLERLSYRLEPIFKEAERAPIKKLVIMGCALFNHAHTDVIDSIPQAKRERIVEGLSTILAESRVEDISFIVPRSDLLRPELRDHFHPFMFASLDEVASHIKRDVPPTERLFGAAHAHRRTDAEIARALEASGDGLVREIAQAVSVRIGMPITTISWSVYIGEYLAEAAQLAEKTRDVAEAIYLERVKTRPSYATLHAIDPHQGLKRTIANNVFYLAEAMYLRDHPDTGIVNCEFADTFWLGLEQVLKTHVPGSAPYIGMVPKDIRQPWGY